MTPIIRPPLVIVRSPLAQSSGSSGPVGPSSGQHVSGATGPIRSYAGATSMRLPHGISGATGATGPLAASEIFRYEELIPSYENKLGTIFLQGGDLGDIGVTVGNTYVRIGKHCRGMIHFGSNSFNPPSIGAETIFGEPGDRLLRGEDELSTPESVCFMTLMFIHRILNTAGFEDSFRKLRPHPFWAEYVENVKKYYIVCDTMSR